MAMTSSASEPQANGRGQSANELTVVDDFVEDPADEVAAREEKARHARFLQASQRHSGEAQGVFAAMVPEVADAPADPYGSEPSSPSSSSLSFSTQAPPSAEPSFNALVLPPVLEGDEASHVSQYAAYNAQAGQAPGPTFNAMARAVAPAADATAGPQLNGTAGAADTSKPRSHTPFAEQSKLYIPFEGAVAEPAGPPGSPLKSSSPRTSGHLASISPRSSGRLGPGSPLGYKGKAPPAAGEKTLQRKLEGDAAEMLAHLTPAQQLVLEFRNVSCWVDTGDYGAAKGPLQGIIKPMKDGAGKVSAAARRVTSVCTRSPAVSDSKDVEMGAGGAQSQAPPPSARNRQILHSISGHVLPGQVLALMGPSGSGKTSLLSILGGRAPAKLKLDGSVTVNGARLSKATRRRIGFVLQDDVLYETLTVFETLTFAGLLRLPRTMTRAEKMARVETVMTVLGLTKARDTIIGGYFRRGVSGGERKRVSCGQELLINPSVLLLDEPTSGLDSTTALHLVKLLHDLAAGGRAILTTIHQPSSRLYHHLDKVMLLAEGHVMYMGDALLAADWFNHLGFQLPYGVNLADHLLDCAMGEVEYDSEAAGAYTGEGSRRGGPYNPEGSRRGGKDMHGRVAVASLYTTFERWYATHPNGFSHPTTPAANGLGATDAGAMSKHDLTSRQSHDLTSRRSHLSQASSSNTMDSVLNEVRLVRCGRPSMQGAPVTPPTVEATAENDPEPAATGTDVPPPTPAVATHVAGASSAGPDGRGEPLAPKLGFRGRTRQLLGLKGNRPFNSVGPAAQQRPGPVAEGEEVQYSWTVTEGEGFQGAGLPGPGPVAEGKEPKGDDSVKDTPFFEQIGILWRRAIKVRRFESLSGQQMAQLVAVAVITGLLWWQRARTDDVAGANDVLGLLFFELVFVAFRSLFSALFTFPNEFRILSKERPSGNPKLSAYYVARTLADLPIEVLLPSAFIIIVYFFGGLRLEAGAFFSNWASVLLIVLVAQSWGLLIGGMFMDPKTAQTVTTVIMLTLMLVGGFYVRDVPVWIGWLKYLSFLYWGNNLLLKIEFRGRTLTDCAAAVAGGPCPQVADVQSALRLPVDPNEAVYPEVLVLLAMLIFLRYATWFVLRWKISATQRSL